MIKYCMKNIGNLEIDYGTQGKNIRNFYHDCLSDQYYSTCYIHVYFMLYVTCM